MGVPRWPGARALVVDALLAVVLTALVSGSAHWWAVAQYPGRSHLDDLGYTLILVACAAVAGRRVWPPAALAVTLAASAVWLLAGYPYGPIFLAFAIGVAATATVLPWRRSVISAGAALGILLTADLPRSGLSDPVGWSEHGLVWSGLLLVAWGTGTIVRLRGEGIERNRQEEARRRAYEQRLEIAREVHDIVGHGLAVINMQASVALHVRDRRPEQAEAALEAIREASKEALEQLRRTLAVFREPENGSAPRRPASGLDQLDALLGTIEAGGLPVAVEVTGDREPLPAAVDLAVFRIVQESLTNVVRHAGPTTAHVRVAFGAGQVEVEVTDAGRGRRSPSRSPGHGIAGMRERAVAVGGRLDAGPRPEGGYRVHAWLPLERR